MPERPLLLLPSPGEPLARQKLPSGGGKFPRPTRKRQEERLSPQFLALQEAFDKQLAQLQVESSDLVPEEVVVLEIVGTVDDFIRAVERVPEMEYLAEVEAEAIPPDDDYFSVVDDGAEQPTKAVPSRIFMVFTNQSALQQMISLWKDWLAETKLPQGFGKWKPLFEQLHDVRRWDVQDRLLETGVLEDWQERTKYGQNPVPCEIELWYRQDPERRSEARNRVTDLVEGLKGRVTAEADIKEIDYHALLVELPAIAVKPLFEEGESDITLVQCEQIQFFRASGQMSAALPDDVQEGDEEVLPGEPTGGSPVVALLDGLPLQAHRWLEGRLVVDDPDGFEVDYSANYRQHGTAMASLILHGDLGAHEQPLPKPLYVRPIFRPDPRDKVNPQVRRETVPEGTLGVDLIHRAVRRLFEGDGGETPVARQVSVINLSIGISDRPFVHALSPLARLLDWLAWRYKVLFVVSAGNHFDEIKLLTASQPSLLPLIDIQEQVIRSVAADARNRRLLSPAESVNALTVGSVHEDESTATPPDGYPEKIDPYIPTGLPSPINAQGMGYRRGIKPDLLAAGGRIVLQRELANEQTLKIYPGELPIGQLVAAPGPSRGARGDERHLSGTSNATALVSRACGLLYDVADDLRQEPGGEIIDSLPRAVWLKALVAHGATWGEAGSILTSILRNPENSRKFKEYVTRLLGYGAVDIGRVMECTARRVTALSGGTLRRDESHIHHIPLPRSLSGWHGYRRLTITLAWLSPVNPQHQAWRRAHLWFDAPKKPLRLNQQQAGGRAVQRGTLQHEILEGKRADRFDEGAKLKIQVSCRAGAGTLEHEVPYALATTLEVAEELGVDIYAEVRTAVHPVQVQPEAGA